MKRRRSIAEAMAGTQIEAALERRTMDLESKMSDTISRLGILESREGAPAAAPEPVEA